MSPLEAPIPGMSLTAPPKSRPWERPPEYTNPGKAMDYLFETMTGKQTAMQLLNLMEAGAPLTALTHTLVVTGVMEGKWTPDVAMLIAEPVMALLYQMANVAGVKINTDNLEDEPFDESFVYLSKVKEKKDLEKQAAMMEQAVTPPPVSAPKSTGFITRPGVM